MDWFDTHWVYSGCEAWEQIVRCVQIRELNFVKLIPILLNRCQHCPANKMKIGLDIFEIGDNVHPLRRVSAGPKIFTKRRTG